LLAVAVALFAVTGAARADQDRCAALAGQTIRWIVPFGAGGGYDIYSRFLEPALEARLDAEIVIVNVPGAGGMVGAKQLRNAKPDGRTLGLLHGTNLLVSELFGAEDHPRLLQDFTLIGRLSRTADIWIVRNKSWLRTVDDLFAAESNRRVVVGLPSIASKHWLAAVIVGDLLGFEADFVSGYKGSKDRVLALLRGEYDVTATTGSTVLPYAEAGEVRSLLMIGESVLGHRPAFRDVVRLGGTDGLAARRARALGRDPNVAQARANALAEIIAAGRIVAAPRGLEPGLAACLEEHLFAVMTDPEFLATMAKANRPIDTAMGTETVEIIGRARQEAASFQPIIRDHLEKAKK
jgi:tripartite-type tricarboxylate transporter receptor subunit TctC